MPSPRIQKRIESLLDQADNAVESQDWRTVKARAEAVLAFEPSNADALSYIEAVSRATGDGGQRVPEAPSEGAARSASTSRPTESAEQPSSFASGRYSVTRFLGEGGKKKVYLAHDHTLDRDVAFALIKTEGLDETSRERVKREAQAMGRMGTHPCIMPIYDLGEEDGQPFMVQPLMGGGDVEGLIEDAEGPLPLEDALRIATQAARGLVFAHSKGIVHRDLKPGNVWLDDDGAAKIGDFGLAIATDRSRLTVEKVMVGTVNYMPPEQATGAEVTPAADLYSLGAMLYEMCTGRVPFMGDDDIAVISQHVNTPAVAPSWHNSRIPKTLDSLILRLMAKDPSERPGSAEEVLQALDAVDLLAVEEKEEGAGGSLDSMAGGVFVGRQREMDQLKAAFEEVLSGRGRMLTLVGEPGIGKTRTAQELATYAGMRGANVLWGRCYEEKGAPPYCPWLQAIWECSKDLEPGELRSLLGSAAPEIADAVPYIRERLPDIPSAVPLDPDQARYRFFNSTAKFLQNVSLQTPLLIVLDDVHWADESSLLLLSHLVPIAAASRIMVVLAYRDSELSLKHPLSRALADLQKQESFTRIWVRGLSREDVDRYIEGSAGVEPPQGLVDAVFTQTEGNPLFVTEVVRMLVEERQIGPHGAADRDSWTSRIPEGVKVVVGTRLSKLNEETIGVLSAAAVIGREFDLRLLDEVLGSMRAGEKSPDTATAISESVRARIVDENPRAVGHFRFAHSLIQQTLLEELTTYDRMRLNNAVAAAMVNRPSPDPIAVAAHLAEAGPTADLDMLIRYTLDAGEELLDRYAYEEARDAYQGVIKVLDLHVTDTASANLHFGLGRAQAALMQVSEAVENLTQAFEYYESRGDVPNLSRVASCPVGEGRTGAPELVKRAIENVDGNSHTRAELLSQWGLITGLRGEYESSAKAFDTALQVATNEEDVALMTWTLARRGHVEIFHNRPRECVEVDGQALELNKSLGDPHVAAYAGICMVSSLTALGESDRALVHCDARISSAEEVRWQSAKAQAYSSAAKIWLIRGDWDRARELIGLGLAINPDNAYARSVRVIIDLVTGETDSARARLDDFVKLIGDGARVDLHTYGPLVIAEGDVGVPTLLPEYKQLARKVLESSGTLPAIEDEAIFTVGVAAIFEQDGRAAEIIYEQIKDLAETWPMFGNDSIATDRILGLLKATSGDTDVAGTHFESAIDFLDRAGYRPELARTYFDYSSMLLDRGDPGDHEKAIELQDEAIAIARELGMKPLLERVLAKREILKA